MTLDIPLAIGGLFVGIIVGLTGMGGGALMTPMLVFFFQVDPLTAISSDIVVSLFMKPVGAFVHLRHGTVNMKLVGWLCLGSVPLAFMGAWLISLVPEGVSIDVLLKRTLGVALLISTAALFLRAVVQMWNNRLPLGEGPAPETRPDVVIRPIPTVVLGAVAGLMVGLTSVGAGSIVVVALLFLYPRLKASSLVGTDLTQAVPLVAAAALGHILFGSFSLAIAALTPGRRDPRHMDRRPDLEPRARRGDPPGAGGPPPGVEPEAARRSRCRGLRPAPSLRSCSRSSAGA